MQKKEQIKQPKSKLCKSIGAFKYVGIRKNNDHD